MNKLTKLTQAELGRQKSSLNLIASENYPSPAVLAQLGTIWNAKYAEGYPGKRYYAGNIHADVLETYVGDLALRVFDRTGEYGVNVQALSGSPANALVYLAALEPGDTILSPDLSSGGHLSHLHQTSSYRKFFGHATYSVSSDEGAQFDLAEFTERVIESKPKLVVVGFSSYARHYPLTEMCRIAHRHGALVLADISHVAGLVVASLHPSPFAVGEEGADFITTTTHKTLRGPRSALIFAKQPLMTALNKTIFPGTSGGPHMDQIAAVGQCLLEVLDEERYPDNVTFAEYMHHTLTNTAALEQAIVATGIESVWQTQNHITLLRLPDKSDSLEIQNRLENAGIITNRNAIPFDIKSAWRPSGLRLGAAALTSRGLNVETAEVLGKLVGKVISRDIEPELASRQVNQITKQLSWWY